MSKAELRVAEGGEVTGLLQMGDRDKEQAVPLCGGDEGGVVNPSIDQGIQATDVKTGFIGRGLQDY